MVNEIKEAVLRGNLELPRRGLVRLTFGNVSGRDADSGLVAIKPSGVPYEELTTESIVVVGLDGTPVSDRQLQPSSDIKVHLALYRAFPELGGIVHMHAAWTTAWAQAKRPIPALGTTHADHFLGEIPCTRALTEKEINEDYELATGLVIVETVAASGRAPLEVPGVLVCSHGPFAWGRDVETAVYHAVVLEEVARMALLTLSIDSEVAPLPEPLLRKHFLRKHGRNRYYGQADAEGLEPSVKT
jgi:L-ribulose-5-phosphate 4-epimerase